MECNKGLFRREGNIRPRKGLSAQLYQLRPLLPPPGQEICRLYYALEDETGDGRGEF